MYAANQACMVWYQLEYCRHVLRRRRQAHALATLAAGFVDHEKRVAWVSISMRENGSVPTVIVLRLATPRAVEAPLLFNKAQMN